MLGIHQHKFIRQGAAVTVESRLGETCRYTDGDYEKVGATVSSDREYKNSVAIPSSPRVTGWSP